MEKRMTIKAGLKAGAQVAGASEDQRIGLDWRVYQHEQDPARGGAKTRQAASGARQAS